MMRSFKLFIGAALLVACTHAVPTPTPVQVPVALPPVPALPPLPVVDAGPPTVAKVEPAAPQIAPVVVEGKGWTVTVPGDWKVTTEPDPAPPGRNIKNEMDAESNVIYGAGPARAALMSTPIKKGMKATEWVTTCAQHISSDSRVHIIQGLKTKVNGSPAIVILAIRELENDVQLATVDLITAANGRGYILTCNGDPEGLGNGDDSEGFGAVCMAIEGSFTAK